MKKHCYTGPTVEFMDGRWKGKRFEPGRLYEDFPESIAGRMELVEQPKMQREKKKTITQAETETIFEPEDVSYEIN